MINFTKNRGYTRQSFFSKNLGGYTLAEIVVVIAIIGLLAGFILVAMGPARQQGKAARISSDLVQLQSQAEIIYLDDGDYGNVDCLNGPPEIVALCDDVAEQGSSVDTGPDWQTVDTYCAYAYFPNSSQGFCVDYTGFADKIPFPSLSCGPRSFCGYMNCPDFNENGVVDTTDRDCVIDCTTSNFNVDPPDVDPDCDSNPLCYSARPPCAGFECEIYDVAGDDRVVDPFNDVPAVINLLGTSCE